MSTFLIRLTTGDSLSLVEFSSVAPPLDGEGKSSTVCCTFSLIVCPVRMDGFEEPRGVIVMTWLLKSALD